MDVFSKNQAGKGFFFEKMTDKVNCALREHFVVLKFALREHFAVLKFALREHRAV